MNSEIEFEIKKVIAKGILGCVSRVDLGEWRKKEKKIKRKRMEIEIIWIKGKKSKDLREIKRLNNLIVIIDFKKLQNDIFIK